MTIRLIFLLLVSSQAHAWGIPATATTTIKANITNWNENPCDFGNRFVEACEYAKQHNLFPEASQPTISVGGWTSTPTQTPNRTATVTDYGSFIQTTTTTNYE